MAPLLLRRLLLAASFLFAAPAFAAAPADLHARADADGLATHPYWRLLLRYEPANTASGRRSEALSTRFFMAGDGRDNPASELHALLDGLFSSDASPDEASACRFPARAAWLQQQLHFIAAQRDCPQLKEWKQAVNPEQATLVFAADYLNNPSSMFGHTFLRLDAPGQTEDTRLLAYAVNYAANTGKSNPLTFAWKGLSGGYPGVFSLMPYYDKVKEYSDMENRDLWEYQLSFTPVELQRMLDHLWELRGVDFPYYFLTRNCSFQLLSLMEVARPGLALRQDFPFQAIPTDTVRRVLAEPDLLRKLVYRPAAERRLLQDARDNPRRVNQAARVLARDPAHVTGLPPQEDAAALEVAYDFRYYLFMSGKPDPAARQALRQLLVRRAAAPAPDQRTPPLQPATDPANGHPTARLGLALGQARSDSYAALRLRPAYHDLLDPPGGYRKGAHIDFLDTELRVDEDRQELRLERLALIDIDSLAPWDDFFRPWSWFVGFGYRQAAVDSRGRFSHTTSHGVAYIEGGAGASVEAGERVDCFLLLAADGEAGSSLEKGTRAGVGPRAGCLLDAGRTRLRLQADTRWHNDDHEPETRTMLEGQLQLDPRNGLRLQAGALMYPGRRQGFGEASWVHYF